MGAAKVLDKEINHYLGHLYTHQKEVVLSVIKTFAQEENQWWDTVEDSAKESIDRGLKQAKDGNVIHHDEVMKTTKNGCRNKLDTRSHRNLQSEIQLPPERMGRSRSRKIPFANQPCHKSTAAFSGIISTRKQK